MQAVLQLGHGLTVPSAAAIPGAAFRRLGAMPRVARTLLAGAAASAVYGTLIERNAFTLRRFDVPVLPPGTDPIRVLHVSDLHLTPLQRRKQDWIRDLRPSGPTW